jgi:hypothetical protein
MRAGMRKRKGVGGTEEGAAETEDAAASDEGAE